MTDTELRRLLTESLGDVFLQRNGQILYSGIDTLRPGDFYFVGFNPAADGTNPRLCEVPLDRQHWSAYTQQCWKHKHEESAVCSDAGRAPHQRRVQGIMAELGLQAEETFAANLIFVESRNTEKIKEEIRNGLFETCWQVPRAWRRWCLLWTGNGWPPRCSSAPTRSQSLRRRSVIPRTEPFGPGLAGGKPNHSPHTV